MNSQSTLDIILGVIFNSLSLFFGSSIATVLGFGKLFYQDIFKGKKPIWYVALLLIGVFTFSALCYIVIKLLLLSNDLNIIQNGEALKAVIFCSFFAIMLFIFGLFLYYKEIVNKKNGSEFISFKSLDDNKTVLDNKKQTNLQETVNDNINCKQYLEGYSLINNIFVKVHDARRLKKDEKEALSFLCDQLKSFFEKTSKSTCSVCVKVIDKKKPINLTDVLVETYCRDSEATHKRKTNNKHLIRENTAFFETVINLTNKKDYFFCNDLIAIASNYSNSSFNDYGLLPSNFSKMRRESQESNWYLPYKSEIVVSIYRPDNNKYKLVGFLCIDSNKSNSFDEIYDLAIVRGISYGIFELVEIARDQTFKN